MLGPSNMHVPWRKGLLTGCPCQRPPMEVAVTSCRGMILSGVFIAVFQSLLPRPQIKYSFRHLSYPSAKSKVVNSPNPDLISQNRPHDGPDPILTQTHLFLQFVGIEGFDQGVKDREIPSNGICSWCYSITSIQR